MSWKASGILTLLTDFGLTDSYVGIMKGVIHERFEGVREIVDLTHAIPPQDIRAGAFELAHAWSYFPVGTVHLAVVDPGVGSSRRALLALDRGHAFVAPDNGLLSPVLGAEARFFDLDVERIALPNRSSSFHGRDVFAPAAAALASGVQPEELGQPTTAGVELGVPQPVPLERPNAWRGEIIRVDRFGNLISNLPVGLLEGLDPSKPAQLFIRERTVPVVGTYSEAREGELLGLVDSYDLFEVALCGGNAAELLQCGVGEQIEMELSR